MQTINKKKILEMYRLMVTIRQFELTATELYRFGFIQGYLHLYLGEEAIAAGGCLALKSSDYITSTHRGHGHCIAKGADVKIMMAELLGKKTGYCKGMGGSMHITNIQQGNLGANGIVGGGIPIAVGAGLGIKKKGTDQVVLSFFSDGAAGNGVFPESMNLAAIWKLPVVFILENNRYAVSTPISQTSIVEDLAKRGDGFGVPGEVVDGNDVGKVFEKVTQAVNRAREGKGPTLIEAKTFRRSGHNVNDPSSYVPKDQMKYWQERDPIDCFRKRLLKEEEINESELQRIDREVKKLMEEAVEFAKSSPEPSVNEFLKEIEE